MQQRESVLDKGKDFSLEQELRRVLLSTGSDKLHSLAKILISRATACRPSIGTAR